ncbi:MAG: PilZ domain-containing protein [Butyrivibrio sp.]|nr:PilZ domain-containing protein [Butyrivibrio sp.]
MEEKRKYRRLELTGELIMEPIGKGGDNPETVSISILNCSRAGLGFLSDVQLVMGDNYEANLTIWTKEVLHVFIKIVRGTMLESGFEYGAIFIGMPDYDMQRISVYETVQDTLEGVL